MIVKETTTESVTRSDFTGEKIAAGRGIAAVPSNPERPIKHFQDAVELVAYALLASPHRSAILDGLWTDHGLVVQELVDTPDTELDRWEKETGSHRNDYPCDTWKVLS